MITEKDIIKAYTRIRTIDNTIPDEVLDFMKDASVKQLRIGGVVKSFYCYNKEKGFAHSLCAKSQCSTCKRMEEKQ